MKRALSCILIILPVLFTGCFAPVNLTYDSARTLSGGEIQVKGMYSRYYEPRDNEVSAGDTSVYGGFLNQNFGFGVSYGISDRYSLGVRYEYLQPTATFQGTFADIADYFNGMNSFNYFEIDNKISLKKNKVAVSLPLGAYVFSSDNENSHRMGLGWFSFDPRLYLTFFSSSKVFEMSVIPKAHCLFGSFGAAVLPGISIGAGFSNDLDRWSIRPEAGYDGYLSFGVGASFNLGTGKNTADR